MINPVWITVVVLSAIGLPTSPIANPPSTTEGVIPILAGGPPDTLVVNSAASSIRWSGTGFGGRGTREGRVTLAHGMFVIRHERLTSGAFTVDMRSTGIGEYVEAERYPTAEFRSTGSKRVGQTRWQVSGDLTMRGVSRPISFDADVQWPETGHMVVTSTFTIDRRQWGLASRGGGLAEAVVDDDIQLSLTLDARRKQPRVATR